MHCLGLTPHPLQWAEVLNDQLRSIPVMDLTNDRLPYDRSVTDALRWLEGNYSSVLLPSLRHAEARALFREHDEGLHLRGLWEVADIWPHCSDSWPDLCELVRAIDAHLPGFGSVQEARFAKLHPNTFLVNHTAFTNQRIKIHCGIVNPSHVQMEIADRVVAWEDGRCYLVDDSFQHGIRSSREALPRTILELKIL